MASCTINKQDDRPLDPLLSEMSVQVLEDLEEDLPCHISTLGDRTLPLPSHSILGDILELLLTASLPPVDQPNAHVLGVRRDHDGRGDVGPGVSALVVHGPVISTWRQDTLMLHS